MSDIKVLALDLDGTLTNDQKLVTPRTRAALDAAIEKASPSCWRPVGPPPASSRWLRSWVWTKGRLHPVL